MNEGQHQGTVIDLAERLLWLAYHTHDSRHSAAGFPDLVLVRDQRIVFVELKTETGKLSTPQELWLAALRAAGAEVYVWRPSDMDEIVRVLMSRERPLEAVPA